MRSWDKQRPETLTAPPDGQTLEGLIGELQSVWGVPQYPQEYRITIKVAEERDARAERAVPLEEVADTKVEEARPSLGVTSAGPRREKAPAAPRVGGGDGDQPQARRRRGRRRRRRGRGGPNGSSGSNGAPSS